MYRLAKPDNTDLAKCLRSGQHFQWKVLPSGYVLWTGQRIWYVKEEKDSWILEGSSPESLHHFLDLDQDYGLILSDLAQDKKLTPLLEYGRGLRLLNQEIWDTILAFILSTNNNIGRIQASLLSLGREYGYRIASFEGEDFYALPSPQVLSSISPQEIRQKVGAGYRDKYLVGTAQMIVEGQVDLRAIPQMPYDQALKEICKFPGVGKKAGDCILLFALGFKEAFPVDTWMEKIMVDLYGPFQSRQAIADFGMKTYGAQAGFVQQILFHAIRSQKRKN